ncbi:hypothetical protein AB4Y36_10220 [Paraburkholderia sp. BR10936]|uniref:hypothetical protein n=1 Tax=Paraburkholderia sp. BR10936 TaxID=3236993 RepID=UPI0034D175A8
MIGNKKARALFAAKVAMRFDSKLRHYVADQLSEAGEWAYGAQRWRSVVVRLWKSKAVKLAALLAGMTVRELVSWWLIDAGYVPRTLAGRRDLIGDVMGVTE